MLYCAEQNGRAFVWDLVRIEQRTRDTVAPAFWMIRVVARHGPWRCSSLGPQASRLLCFAGRPFPQRGRRDACCVSLVTRSEEGRRDACGPREERTQIGALPTEGASCLSGTFALLSPSRCSDVSTGPNLSTTEDSSLVQLSPR